VKVLKFNEDHLKRSSMKVLIYNANRLERKYLTTANKDRHQLVFAASPLNESSIVLAEHFDVISVSAEDKVTAKELQKLKEMNVRLISIRAASYDNVDVDAAKKMGIRVANMPKELHPPIYVKDLLDQMAAKTFYNIDCLAKNKICKNELTDFRIKKQETHARVV